MKSFPGVLNRFPVSIPLDYRDTETLVGQVYDTYSSAVYGFLVRHFEKEIADKLLEDTFVTIIKDLITQCPPPSEIQLIVILNTCRKLIQNHNPDIQFKI